MSRRAHTARSASGFLDISYITLCLLRNNGTHPPGRDSLYIFLEQREERRSAPERSRPQRRGRKRCDMKRSHIIKECTHGLRVLRFSLRTCLWRTKNETKVLSNPLFEGGRKEEIFKTWRYQTKFERHSRDFYKALTYKLHSCKKSLDSDGFKLHFLIAWNSFSVII